MGDHKVDEGADQRDESTLSPANEAHWTHGIDFDTQEATYDVDPFIVDRPRFQGPSLLSTTGLDVQEEIYEREEMHVPGDDPEMHLFAPLMSNIALEGEDQK